MEHNGNGRAAAFARWIVKWRFPVLIGSIMVMLAAGAGGRNLVFSDDYRDFFGEENPQLSAFEALQDIYTNTINILIVLEPTDGTVFTGPTLAAIEDLTVKSWQIPFASRVDALTNFQHVSADGDDLVVADLVANAESLDQDRLEEIKEIALAEPLLVKRVVSESGHVTGVNVTLQLPGQELDETARAVAYARQLASELEAENPNINTYLTGMAMLNNAFSENGIADMQKLVPLMYLGIILVMFFSLRSFTATGVTVVVIAASVVTAMGLAGWIGVRLTPPSAIAPTMIMTLAVADSIHILVSMLTGMRHGMNKREAIVDSLRINMQPVFLTSLTTSIGFLSMNFSDSPPFRDLGNITAVGVVFAFFFSVTMLPALLAILPIRSRVVEVDRVSLVDRFAEFVVRSHKGLLWGSAAIVVVFAVMVSRNELNDQFVDYFDSSIQFRVDSDFSSANLTGVYQIDFSVESGQSGGISEPEYLQTIQQFADWYREQPNVIQVVALPETMARLNKSMHGDDPAWHVLPDNRDLAAQYLLLYEMSLPYGLDLNNQINVDKSATRVTVIAGDITSRELRELSAAGRQWLIANGTPSMVSEGAGAAVMFSHISERNIKGMLTGTTVAFALVSIVLVIAFKSWKFGLLSLIPNLAPAVVAFGLWGVFVGRINIALSVVAAMTFGIVVDDTVHFLSKYFRARKEKGLGPEESVRYAFHTVGSAIVITSVILVVGFSILSFSAFDINASMGRLTAVTILLALLTEFFMLPPLLLRVEARHRQFKTSEVDFDGVVNEPIKASR